MPKILWDREEIILALDLYFSLRYGQMDGRNQDVIAMSDLLSLRNSGSGIKRSTSAVSLKLANLKRLDPNFTGKGMKSGNQLEQVIWDEFFHQRELLNQSAENIKDRILGERRSQYIQWLEVSGKESGSPYRQQTIKTYALQLEDAIAREFGFPPRISNLFGLTDMELLARIDALMQGGEDSPFRKDLRTTFQSYIRFVTSGKLSDDIESISAEDGVSRTEGGRKVYISYRTERNKFLRNQAVLIQGTSCKACGFDFGQFYGPWGNGFIEVHHLVPFDQNLERRETNPAKDLIVLCSNCHRMIHRFRGITLSLTELKQKIDLARTR